MSDTNKQDKRWSRRRFLKVGGTLAGVAAVGGPLAACGDVSPTAVSTAAATTAATSATTAAATGATTAAANATTAAGSATTAAGSAATTAAATSAATTASASGALPFAGRTLTMFVYAGSHEKSFREVFSPAFEAATGAKVNLIPGWWDAIAKLKSSPDGEAPFDLLESDPIQSYPAIRDNLFTRIDLSKIPNAKNFAPKILDSFVYKENWGVPFISSPLTLFWNKELVPDGMKKWSDLFSDGMKGKITLYNSYYVSLHTFATAKVELDGKPGTAKAEIENNLDGVLQFAKEKREWVKYWWPTTTDGVNAVLQKNAHAGNIHGNGIITPLRDGKPIGYLLPEADRAFVQLFFVVPKISKNKDLAEAAINFFATDQIQRDMGLKIGELSVNSPSVAVEVAVKQEIWSRFYPAKAADFDAINYYAHEAYDKNSDKISKFWDREVLRKA